MKNSGKCHISIVLPCYNPPEDWAENILNNVALLEKELAQPIQVVLVNDGSSNGISGEDIRKLESGINHFKSIAYFPNRGKGYALRQGMQQAGADFYLYTDIDFPYTTGSVLEVVKALGSGVNIAPGSRDLAYYEQVPFWRSRISKSLRWVMKGIFKLQVSDTQCGLKGFDQKGKERFLETTIDRYLFDLEFLMKASKDKSLTIRPVPVNLREGVTFSKMGWRILLSESRNLMKVILKS